MEFLSCVQKVAAFIRGIDRQEVIRIVTHLDADGICASAIMTRALARDSRKFSLSILKQLDEPQILALGHESYSCYLFLDLGSGHLALLQQHLHDKSKIILDHHAPQPAPCDNLLHLNPHLFGIDGSDDISGAGVSYLVAKELDESNKDLAHLPIIGAIGDAQEHGGFTGLNQRILSDAVSSGMLKVVEALRLFGSQTRPLHKALELCTDPFIPGVTNSESGAIQFLMDIGIDPKKAGKWRTLSQLSEKEQQQLLAGIILRRAGEEKPEDIFGLKYVLPHEPVHSPYYDAREFSTILNACGRLEKPAVGIGICLGSRKAKEQAVELLVAYKHELMNAMVWIKQAIQASDGRVLQDKGFLIINAQHQIRPSIVGTLTSMLAKSPEYNDKEIILMLGRDEEGMTKISCRSPARHREMDVRGILKEILHIVGGECGGHQHAAGAMIAQEKEPLFMETAAEIFRKKLLEEKIR